MTIDISNLINSDPDAFEERLEAFKKTYPHLFKEECVALVRWIDLRAMKQMRHSVWRIKAMMKDHAKLSKFF